MFSLCALGACRGPEQGHGLGSESGAEALDTLHGALAQARTDGSASSDLGQDAPSDEYMAELEEAYLTSEAAVEGPGNQDPTGVDVGPLPGVDEVEALTDEVPEIDLDELLLSAAAPDDGGEQINPYDEFGERIVWYRDSGLIMKTFTFPLGVAAQVQQLMQTHLGLPIHAAPVDATGMPEGEQPPGSVVLHVLTGLEQEAYSAPRTAGVTSPRPIPLGDWLVVTAAPAEMRSIQRFIRAFVTSTRQIQVEAKIVELTTSKTSDYGIRPVDGVTPIFGLPNAGSLIHSVDFSFGNTVDVGEAIFGVSAVFDGVQFNALLEMIATNESASIVSQPKVAVREGARAELVELEQEPVMKLSAINASGQFSWNVTFKDVGVQLYVVPHVIGTNTIVLNVDTEVSQITGTAATFILTDSTGATSTVGIPEVARRKATTTVRLDQGQGLVIGGLITERVLDREKKVPLLGDMPLIGNIFKSHYQIQERTDVLFFIYPRILQGMDLNTEL